MLADYQDQPSYADMLLDTIQNKIVMVIIVLEVEIFYHDSNSCLVVTNSGTLGLEGSIIDEQDPLHVRKD